MSSNIKDIITLEKLNLSMDELQFTSPSGRYSVTFEHIEHNIFKTTIKGYYDQDAYKGHTAITDKIFDSIEKIQPGKMVYFIEDTTHLKWMTPEARKASIAKYRSWDKHGGSYVYGANKFLFSLNKIILATDYAKSFHFAASEKDALQKIRRVINTKPIDDNLQLNRSQQLTFDLFDKLWEKEKEMISVNGRQYRIINKSSWQFNSDTGNFLFKCSLIEGNIFLMKLSGFQNQSDVDKTYSINNSIIKEFSFNKSDNKIFSVGDLKQMKGVSLKARNKNTKHEVEFREYSNIFIAVPSPTLKALIK
ncbi:MAG: hypothetical protein DRJ05_02035, partial [Bacteroidetes bacterium]